MQRSVKVSMRKLAIALFSACLVVLPLSVHALGFGNIRINSALNEPLDAEIDLLSATKSDLKGLKIKLASQEAFMRAGVERPAHLSQLRFAIRTRSNGRPYLKLSTKTSIREPFLDFLLEMNWKNGRMLREYTVLLDPPGQMQQQQPTVIASPKTESPKVVVKQEAATTESPFVEAEEVEEIEEVVEAEPIGEVVEPEPSAEVIAAEPVELEPLEDESIAASSEDNVEPEPVAEADPVPEAETVPEEELDLELEPEQVEASEESIAQVDTESEAEVTEPVKEAEPDLLADESIEIELDDVPSEKATETVAEAEAAEPFTEEKQTRLPAEDELAVEESEIADEPLTSEEVAGESGESEQPIDEPLAEESLDEKPGIDMQEGVTTKKKDNLWKIAEAMQQDDSVTIYQVMMALQQSNPDAFVEGNVHRLKVGQVLRIDDPSLLTAMSKRQAALEYTSQTHAWEDYRQQLAGGDTPTQAVMAGEGEGDGSGTGTAMSGDDTAVEQTSGELVLAAPEGDTQSAGTSVDKEPAVSNEVVILREEIRQALKEAQIEGNKNIELNARLRELEGQLNDLQRSLSVKDDELASLQQQLSSVNQQNTEQELQDQAAKQAAEAAAAEAEMAREQAAVDEAVARETAAKAEADAKAAAEAAKAEQPGAEQVAISPEIKDPTTTPGVTDPTAAYTDPEPAGQTKGFLDNILASLPFSPTILAAAGGGIVFLIVLLAFSIKRRRQTSDFQESILSGVPSEDMTMPEEVSLETNLSGESSFLSDFAISGASALQSEDNEVDPLTEADVFMAYGRYEAAEERIVEAINKDPQRSELRIKLLELYNTTRDRDSFERAAEEFYASIGHDAGNQQWQKVIAMGTVLAPDSPLFNESNMAAATDDLSFGTDHTAIKQVPTDPTVMKPAPVDQTVIRNQPVDQTVIRGNLNDEVMDIGLDTGAFQTDDLTNAGADQLAQVEDELNLDMDLDMDMDVDLNLGAPADDNPGDIDLSFDLDGPDSMEINLDEGLDLDIGSEDVAEPADVMDLEFDLEDQDFADETMEVSAAINGAAPELEMDEQTMQGLDMGGGDMTMEMSQPAEALSMDSITATDMAGAELDATDAMELDVPPDMDEVGTKLDLAKAYIDMGDPDGAKSILDEVLTEGTPPQQQEAQQLMQQI